MTIQCSLGHDNPDGSAFCDECGEPLASAAPIATGVAPMPAQATAAPASAGSQACPSCGSINTANEAFCSNCGNMLGAPAPAIAHSEPIPTAASAAPALTARLIVEADNQEFDLSGKDNIMLGREDAVSNIYPDVDLSPHGGEEGGVSRLHARIFYDNGQYLLEDENSTNFTYLNRQKLAGKTPTVLHDNDEVRLGRVLLRFKEA
ncbi:MAG: FHA domain-containing protein [Ktedonobacteraceae bacterium]